MARIEDGRSATEAAHVPLGHVLTPDGLLDLTTDRCVHLERDPRQSELIAVWDHSQIDVCDLPCLHNEESVGAQP